MCVCVCVLSVPMSEMAITGTIYCIVPMEELIITATLFQRSVPAVGWLLLTLHTVVLSR